MLDVTYYAEALNDTINLTNLYYFIFAWFNIRIIIRYERHNRLEIHKWHVPERFIQLNYARIAAHHKSSLYYQASVAQWLSIE